MVLNCVNWFKFYSYTYDERVIYFTKMCKVLLTLVTNEILIFYHRSIQKIKKIVKSLYIYILIDYQDTRIRKVFYNI